MEQVIICNDVASIKKEEFKNEDSDCIFVDTPDNRAEKYNIKEDECETKESDQTANKSNNGLKRYSCELCEKVFTKKHLYKVHVMVHKGNSPYKCEFCGKNNFLSKYLLDDHLLVHSNEKKFECYNCGTKFKRKNNLRTHIMQYHSTTLEYNWKQCEKCDKRFRNKTKFEVHMMTHENQKTHTCPICGKQFYESNLLFGHVQTHEFSRPFACEICGETFRTQASLLHHESIHSQNCIKCQECGKVCKKRSGLICHIWTHGDADWRYSCHLCNKGFNYLQEVKDHVRKHIYDCTLCGRLLTSVKSGVIHSVIHQRDGPFVCQVCGMSFALNPHLRFHMKRQHDDDSFFIEKDEIKLEKYETYCRTIGADNNFL